MRESKFKVAAAHVAPRFLDPVATADKAVALMGEAARQGASLIAFPESFIPGFPLWAAIHAPIRTHDAFHAFAAASIYVDGPEVRKICGAAAENRILVSVGFSERDPASGGALWNSNLLIDDSGSILVHHRKLVPTFFEKLAWNPGDGHGLKVADTRIAKIGALICGENTNPLARYALIAQGEQLHIASYPPVWPTRPPDEAKNYDNRSANRIRAAAHAFEGKCFVVVVGSCLDEPALQLLANDDPDAMSVLRNTPRSESFFVDPTGAVFGEATSDEGIVYADIDLADCIEPKRFHDVAAGYNRFDVFTVSVRSDRRRPLRLFDEPQEAGPGAEPMQLTNGGRSERV